MPLPTLAELAREVGAVDYTAIYQGVRRLETRSKKTISY